MQPESPARVFRLDASRSHAAWATAGVWVWWAGLILVVQATRASDQAMGPLAMLWFFWQFFGVAAVPYAARRIDDALASRRGDTRALHRPYLTALGGFVGSMAAVATLIGAIVATTTRLPDLGGDAWIVVVMALGAWLGARIAAGRSSDVTVTLGYDALSYQAGRRTTVVALRDITAVRHAPGELLLDRRDAPTLAIDLRRAAPQDPPCAPAIERAVSDARAPFPAGAALHREGRALAAWREAMRAKASGATDFRAQALDRDDLEAALVHPGATPEERVGAALALRELDAAGVTRVRVAADAAVAPALRDALRAVADGAADEDIVRGATGTSPGAADARS